MLVQRRISIAIEMGKSFLKGKVSLIMSCKTVNARGIHKGITHKEYLLTSLRMVELSVPK
jgi:hypothetical protein